MSVSLGSWVRDCVAAHPGPGTLGALTQAEALDGLATCDRLLAQVEAARLAHVAELDQLRAGQQGPTTASMIASTGRVSGGRAAGEVRLASRLAELPALQSAFADGHLSRQQAEVAVQQVESISTGLNREQRRTVDEQAAARARETDPRQLRHLGEELLRQIRPETAEEELADRAERYRRRAWAERALHLIDDERGVTHVRGALPILEGTRLRLALNGIIESARRGRERLTSPASREQRMADALVALAEGQGGAPGSQLIVTVEAERLIPNRSAARGASQGPPGAAAGIDMAGRTEAAVEGRGGQGRLFGRLLDGTVIGERDVRRIACVAEIIPVVLGVNSVPLDVGRAQRLSSRELRAAVHLRDGGCAFPGCDVPAERCEQHHILPWADGGPTALSNLVDLCPHHHNLVEPGPGHPGRQWRAVMLDGLPAFLPPDGDPRAGEPIMHARLAARRRPLGGGGTVSLIDDG